MEVAELINAAMFDFVVIKKRHQGAVALTVGSVPRRIVPELRHFNWLLKMNNQSN